LCPKKSFEWREWRSHFWFKRMCRPEREASVESWDKNRAGGEARVHIRNQKHSSGEKRAGSISMGMKLAWDLMDFEQTFQHGEHLAPPGQ